MASIHFPWQCQTRQGYQTLAKSNAFAAPEADAAQAQGAADAQMSGQAPSALRRPCALMRPWRRPAARGASPRPGSAARAGRTPRHAAPSEPERASMHAVSRALRPPGCMQACRVRRRAAHAQNAGRAAQLPAGRACCAMLSSSSVGTTSTCQRPRSAQAILRQPSGNP